MENLCDLLFELSSAERMNMLNSLRDERLKLSHLAKRLDMTVTETSRHLQRLSDADIVARDTDGTYSLTPLGGLALQLLGSLSFPRTDGSIDYAAFISGDPGFRAWCRDLFQHYWENAKPASALIDDPQD